MIEYTPGDLRALHRYPTWSHITSLIDPALLATHLRPRDTVEVLGQQARRYEGEVNGITLEVWWLEALQLPAFLREGVPDQVVTIHLREIHALHASPWSRSSISAYQHLDYADLGDKESDPFVRSLR